MSDKYVTLLGAEEVGAGARIMRSAADTMSSAAMSISTAADANSASVQQLQFVLDNFTQEMANLVLRFEQAVARTK